MAINSKEKSLESELESIQEKLRNRPMNKSPNKPKHPNNEKLSIKSVKSDKSHQDSECQLTPRSRAPSQLKSPNKARKITASASIKSVKLKNLFLEPTKLLNQDTDSKKEKPILRKLFPYKVPKSPKNEKLISKTFDTECNSPAALESKNIPPGVSERPRSRKAHREFLYAERSPENTRTKALELKRLGLLDGYCCGSQNELPSIEKSIHFERSRISLPKLGASRVRTELSEEDRDQNLVIQPFGKLKSLEEYFNNNVMTFRLKNHFSKRQAFKSQQSI